MTTRTRYFVIASLLVLFVGVGTGLVAYYTGFPALLARPAGTDDLKLLPHDAQLVAYADVRELMGSELRQKVRQALPITGDGQREIYERTGINLETDIERVLVCLAPSRGDQRPSMPLVLARGTFDTSRIEGMMRQAGASVEDYNGARLIVAPNDFAVAFIEPGLAAIGGRSLVQAAVDQRGSGAGVTANADMMDLVRSLDNGDLWAVGRFDALTSQLPLPGGLAQQFPAISWFAANASVDSGVHGTLRADARDQEAADNLREVVRGFIALGRLEAGTYPELKTVLNSLTLAGSGTTVSLGFDVPGSLVDLLGSKAGGFQQAPKSSPDTGK